MHMIQTENPQSGDAEERSGGVPKEPESSPVVQSIEWIEWNVALSHALEQHVYGATPEQLRRVFARDQHWNLEEVSETEWYILGHQADDSEAPRRLVRVLFSKE
jgi:hypothetical protein